MTITSYSKVIPEIPAFLMIKNISNAKGKEKKQPKNFMNYWPCILHYSFTHLKKSYINGTECLLTDLLQCILDVVLDFTPNRFPKFVGTQSFTFVLIALMIQPEIYAHSSIGNAPVTVAIHCQHRII